MTKEDEFYVIEIVSKVDQDASIDPLKCSFFQFQKLKMCICNLCTLATCKMLIFCNTCIQTQVTFWKLHIQMSICWGFLAINDILHVKLMNPQML